MGAVLLFLAALYGTGCTGTAKLHPSMEPIEVPDTWSASLQQAAMLGPDAEELALWWQQLGDPVLDELVERTISGNVDLETAVARVQEARARRGLARSELGPSIALGSSAGRSENLGQSGLHSDSYTASLDIAWESDLFGAKRHSLAASQAELEAETAQLGAARVALVAETVVAYADLRVAEARLGVLDVSLASREETSRLTGWREQAGLASRLEANQAMSNLSLARAGRPLNEQLAAEARLRLSLLAGEIPGTLDELLTPRGAGPAIPTPPGSVSVGIPADTLRQRPDLKVAERQLAAAAERLGAAQAGRLPTLRLSGSLDAQGNDFADLFDLDSVVANLVSGLTAPIFESGRINRNIAVREAQWEQATLAYRGSMLEALSEVEKALSAFHFTQERLAELAAAERTAAEAAELAEQRYAAGLVDLLSVLETQRTVFSTEEQLVIAKGELLNAFANLYRALGGGWESASVQAVAEGGTDV